MGGYNKGSSSLEGSAQVLLRGHKPFKFEQMWPGEEGCSIIINNIWRNSSDEGGLNSLMLLIRKFGEKLQS